MISISKSSKHTPHMADFFTLRSVYNILLELLEQAGLNELTQNVTGPIVLTSNT